MLVGQTVNAYRDAASGADFADLLETVAALDGLERLTFVTSHPKDFDEKLARTLGALPQLNPRFHLPVQSGSNPMLRRMNRKYTVEQYLDKIERFRAHCPGWALTTDLIVGFPGESDERFRADARAVRAGSVSRRPSCSSTRRAAARRRRSGNRSTGAVASRAAARLSRRGRRRRSRLSRPQGRHGRARARRTARRAKIRRGSRAKTPDNVTVVAPLGGSAREASFAERRGSTCGRRRARLGLQRHARRRGAHASAAMHAASSLASTSASLDPGSRCSERYSPLLEQYFGMKARHPDAILLARVGDFYEAYGDDAEAIARRCQIALTSKDAGGGRGSRWRACRTTRSTATSPSSWRSSASSRSPSSSKLRFPTA